MFMMTIIQKVLTMVYLSNRKKWIAGELKYSTSMLGIQQNEDNEIKFLLYKQHICVLIFILSILSCVSYWMKVLFK